MMYSVDRPPLHKRFYLPSRKDLLSLQEGDIVKIIFRTGCDVERMWLILKDCDDSDVWTGYLDNDPYGEDLAKAIKAGDIVSFHPLDIIQIHKDALWVRLKAWLLRRTTKKYLEETGYEK